MSRHTFNVQCPNCKSNLSMNLVLLEVPKEIATYCSFCYFPLVYSTNQNRVEIRIEKLHKKAFLIHSSKREDKTELDWFRALLKLYGVMTVIIEEDTRVGVDWLQKSLDAIRTTDFVISFLAKRYQFTDEQGQVGWKAPDKCYDEIAMSFARQRDLFALVERETDSGRVLQDRAWCFQFDKQPSQGGAPITAEVNFFERLDSYVNRNYVPL